MTQPDHLVLYLSGSCNLACPYCYAAGVARGTVSAPALRRALEGFAAAGPAAPKFTVLGGEPLLCRERLYEALRDIRRLFGQAPVHVFTNGLLLKKGEAARLLRLGVKLAVSVTGSGDAGLAPLLRVLPRPLRGRVSASLVAGPGGAAELPVDLLRLEAAGFRSLAWSPDITAAWSPAALKVLRASVNFLLAEYFRRLRRGRGVWELANGYEAVALAARGEAPGPCRNIALAPDGYFYPCDKMLSGRPEQLRPFRISADGRGREKFFGLAGRLRPAQSMCPVAPWAAAKFRAKSAAVPAGQAAARAEAARWLAGAARAGLKSRLFRELHGV